MDWCFHCIDFIFIHDALFKTGGKNDYEAIPSTILRFPIVQTREEPIGQLAVSSNPLSVAMREFVVLAPSDDKDITLLFTDVVVNLSDITAAEKINKNTAFIRYIIYDTLEAALISGIKKKLSRHAWRRR